MKKIIFIIILATLGLNLYSQKVDFNTRSIDLGEVQFWSQSPAVFLYTNQSSEKIAVLRIDKGSGLKANFKIRYLQPGETDSIIVFYMPKVKGSFKEELLVYFNTLKKPIKLQVSGNIIGLDECPGSPVIEENKIKYVKVIDKETQKPIRNVKVETYHMARLVDKNKTRTDGKFKVELKPSLYEFSIIHPEYFPYNEVRYVRISEKVIVLELEQYFEEVAETHTEKDVIERYEEEIAERYEEIVLIKNEEEESVEEEFEIVFEEEEETPIDELGNIPNEKKVEEKPTTVLDTINKALPTHLYSKNNIVFLIDVSSSMRRRDRMPVLKKSMSQLFNILRTVDDISMITYSSRSQILLESVAAGENKELLNNKLDSIEAKGLTYGVVGLTTAYEMAEKNFKEGSNNQVIIATDGQFNSPDHSQLEMMNLIRSYAAKGITLTIIGFGEESKYIRRMKNMARIGKGNFIHITDEEGMEQILVDEVKMNSKRR